MAGYIPRRFTCPQAVIRPGPRCSKPTSYATTYNVVLLLCIKVIDLLVRLLQFSLQGAVDLAHLVRVFKGAYDVLYTYMIGNSRKNALYFAKYIDFFQTQIIVNVVCMIACFSVIG